MKRVTASLLALFFLVGVIGLNYDAHYCGGELVSENLSFVPTDLSCGMSGMDADQSDEGQKAAKHCCDNHHLSFQIDDDYNDHQTQVFGTYLTAFVPSAILEVSLFEVTDFSYEFIGYSPPPNDRDYIVLNQSFLI